MKVSAPHRGWTSGRATPSLRPNPYAAKTANPAGRHLSFAEICPDNRSQLSHLFLNDPSDQEVKEQFNASVPSEDIERFAKSIADFAEKMTTYAGTRRTRVNTGS